MPQTGFEFGDFSFDLNERCLRRDREVIALQPKTFKTLAYLVERAGQLVTKEELLEAVWPGVYVTDNSLSRCIKEARKALSDDAAAPTYIITVPKTGYRFIAEVQAIETDGQSEAPSSPSPDSPHPLQRDRRRLPTLALLTILTVAIAIGFAWRIADDGSPDPPPAVPSASIAVLPFANLTDQGDTQYFSDGVAEDILNRLARIPELKVAARTSAFAFRDREMDIREIAAQLDVGYVLEGSVRREGDRVLLTAQLIDGNSGYHRWSDQYDRRLDDLFSVQAEIALGIVDQLQIEIRPEDRRTFLETNKHSSDMQAYELYLRGRHLWSQRGEEPIRRSILHFEAALERDPEYATAWAGLAAAWLVLPSYADVPSEDSHAQARASARKALTLDDGLGEAYAVLADLEMQARNWLEADAGFRRAIETDPGNSTAHYWYSEMLANVGRWSDALNECHRALEIDPLAPTIRADCGWGLLVKGDLDAALAHFQRAWDIGLHAMFVWQGLLTCHLLRGDFDAAERWIEELPIPAHPIFGAYVNALRDPAQAPAMTEIVLASFSAGRLPGFQAALMLAEVGEVDKAYGIIDQSVHQRGYLLRTLFAPQTKNLRFDARFGPTVERLGMVEYWQATAWPDFCRQDGDAIRCDR